jgi:hypothetical protein
MKTWRDLTITSKNLGAQGLIGLLRTFGSAGGEWAFSQEMSSDYAPSINRPACTIEWMGSDSLRKPAIDLAGIDDNCATLELANIVPSTMDEYNRIAGRFAKDIRSWARATSADICVELGRTDVGLEQLIPCKKARGYFEEYIEVCRFCGCVSTHPRDLALLDYFTCALHTNSRKYVNFSELERYLREDCSWSEADSRRCIARIEIGRDVLRLYNPRMSERHLFRGWLSPRT